MPSILRRDPQEVLSIDQFQRLAACKNEPALNTALLEDDFIEFRARCFSIDFDERDLRAREFPANNLDIEKMMTHILDCTAALSRAYQLQKRESAPTSENSAETTIAASNNLMSVARRRVFSYALRQTLSGFIEDFEECPSSKAAQEVFRAFPDAVKNTDGRSWLPLHWAMAGVEEVGEEIVKALYAEDPNMLTKFHIDYHEGHDGYTPLHIQCIREKPSLNLLKHFGIVNHGAFDVSSSGAPGDEDVSDGVAWESYHPLHAAAEHCNSVEALQLLIQISPPHVGLKARHFCGQFALGILVYFYDDSKSEFREMFECLLQANSDTAVIGSAIVEIIQKLPTKYTKQDTSESGRSCLFSLLERLVKQHPGSVLEYRDNRYAGGLYDHSDFRTLLTFAASISFSVDDDSSRVIQLIIDAAPELLTTTVPPDNRLPAHVAAREGDFPALKLLLTHLPESWSAKGNMGANLLHYAVMVPVWNYGKEVDVEITKYLCESHPELLTQRDNYGFTPLSLALCNYNAAWKVIGDLIDSDPSAVRIPVDPSPPEGGEPEDYRKCVGMLPLHILARKCLWPLSGEARRETYPYLRKLLHLYPEAAGILDSYGKTPYDYAKEKSMPMLSRLLLRAAPEQDLDEYHRLNWEERRMAMFLGSKAISGSTSATIFAKLRFENKDLLRRVVLFL